MSTRARGSALPTEPEILIRPSAEQLRLSTRQYFAASGTVLAAALINI